MAGKAGCRVQSQWSCAVGGRNVDLEGQKEASTLPFVMFWKDGKWQYYGKMIICMRFGWWKCEHLLLFVLYGNRNVLLYLLNHNILKREGHEKKDRADGMYFEVLGKWYWHCQMESWGPRPSLSRTMVLHACCVPHSALGRGPHFLLHASTRRGKGSPRTEPLILGFKPTCQGAEENFNTLGKFLLQKVGGWPLLL